MAAQAIYQQLYDEVQALPDTDVVQVLDFVQFLKARHEEEAFLWERVEETYAYRRRHSDEVMLMTGDEWMAASAEWESSGSMRFS